MLREGRCASALGSFSAAEKDSSLARLSVTPPSLDGKAAVLLYLFDGFYRRAMSKTVDDSEIDRAGLAKKARVNLWSRKNGFFVTNKNAISVSLVRKEASSAGKLFFSFGRMIHAISGCLLCVQNCALLKNSCIVVAELVTDVQQHRLLGNRRDRQPSRTSAVSSGLASSNECYEAFTCFCKRL